MRKLLTLPTLYGLLSITTCLACVVTAAGFGLPSFATFFGIYLPTWLALFFFVPRYVLQGRYAVPPNIAKALYWSKYPMLISGVLADMGTRQLLFLASEHASLVQLIMALVGINIVWFCVMALTEKG